MPYPFQLADPAKLQPAIEAAKKAGVAGPTIEAAEAKLAEAVEKAKKAAEKAAAERAAAEAAAAERAAAERAAAEKAAAEKATRGMVDLAVATKVFDLFILTQTPSTIAL